MAIADTTGGLIPVAGPLVVREMTVAAATTVRQGAPVKLASGLLTPVAATGQGQIGVALNYGTAGEKVLVSIDPDTIYEGDFADTWAEATHLGKLANVTAEGGTFTYVSDQQIDYTDGTTTTNAVFVIVGAGKRVDDTSRIQVKLYAPAFSDKS